MKALIIGYGSMGRRRIRILEKLIPNIQIQCVDRMWERQKEIEQKGYYLHENLDAAMLEHPDIAFVCTSPGGHAQIILKLIEAGIDVFTELNLVNDQYEEIQKRAKQNQAKVFMSSTMLYDRQIEAITQMVKKADEPLTYIYHVGQYLPDWHPWESYKDFFIGKKETNGCREIYAIQLPWLVSAFGKIEHTDILSDRSTKLDIDFQDSYITMFRHESGHKGVFIVDVVARKAVSRLEIIGEHLHLFWDGTPESLRLYEIDSKIEKNIASYGKVEHVEGYAENIIEEEYEDEVKAFLDYVLKDVEPKYNLEMDRYILSVINQIEGKQ